MGHNLLATMLSPLQREALEYWQGKCAGDALPGRRDLDPTEIPRLLPHILLVDVLAGEPRDFRFRLIGDAVRSRVHQNMTGRRMSEIPHMREGTLRRHYDEVVATARPLAQRVEYVGPDRFVRAATHLLMPLAADGVRVDMVFGVVEFALDRSVSNP